LGDVGIHVVALQKYLEKLQLLIIPDGTTYGSFGSRTAAALTLYQARTGLITTGYLDAATRASLNEKVTKDKYCFEYVSPYALQFTIAAKANRSEIVSNLNTLGITAAGRKFCLSSTGANAASCLNISKLSTFVGYLPSSVNVAKSALKLANYTRMFSKIDYVPADAQTAYGSVVTLNRVTTVTTSTTTSTTTMVDDFETTVTSATSSSQTTTSFPF
jgi:peptidoglycan hydrolase-like protein with peptidoglycan-binding domain